MTDDTDDPEDASVPDSDPWHIDPAGERYRGAWWRRVVKPGLKALSDVGAPARSASEWRYTGEV